jgi:hypothetical protein
LNPGSNTSITSVAWAAGALGSTVGELSIFLHALFAGELLAQPSLTEMTDLGPAGEGLGLFLVGFGRAGTGYGHNGSIPGYTAILAINPDTGNTVVVATNNDQLTADQLLPRSSPAGSSRPDAHRQPRRRRHHPAVGESRVERESCRHEREQRTTAPNDDPPHIERVERRAAWGLWRESSRSTTYDTP